MRVEIDDEFPNHPKVVKAGELAAYLWVCATCYCRRHLTGGFLPTEVIPLLRPGPTTRRLVDALLETGLWVKVDGGFQIHGYSERYDDAAMKEKADRKRQERRNAGRKGGQASWRERSKQNDAFASSKPSELVQATASATDDVSGSTVAEPLNGSGSGEGGSDLWRESEGGAPPWDVWLFELQESYPRHRVTGGPLTAQAFIRQFEDDPRPPRTVRAEMMANLENQKNGHEWRERRMVPTLEKWLRERRWKQIHDADAPPAPSRPSGVDPRLLIREVPAPVSDCPHVEPCESRLVCQRKRTQPEVYPQKVTA